MCDYNMCNFQRVALLFGNMELLSGEIVAPGAASGKIICALSS
jgi:hypothetical protein